MGKAKITGIPAAPQYRGGLQGSWMPQDVEVLSAFIYELHRSSEKTERHPVIEKFSDLINRDPIVRLYVTAMIDQVPVMYEPNPLRTPDDMLRLLNGVLTQAPPFNDTDLVGCPMSAVLVWTMGTPAGFAAYRNEKINDMMKEILDVYSKFLSSEDSLYVLNRGDDGWMSAAAQDKLNMKDNYEYDEDAPHWGFKSWNDFFSRRLAKGARPIDSPDDNKIIVSACDSTTHRIAHNVEQYSKFWIKRQPYSLQDMLANDSLVDEFVGGSIYQAYLSPFNYHRWHSPVSGTIRKAFVQNGLYFSQDTAEGVDPTAQGMSEEYVAHIQTRAIIFIDADDDNIGLMCVMPIGMVEISSCMIDEKIVPGYPIKKGEELGYFQYGGSTHCLIFRPGAINNFTATEGSAYSVGQQIAIGN